MKENLVYLLQAFSAVDAPARPTNAADSKRAGTRTAAAAGPPEHGRGQERMVAEAHAANRRHLEAPPQPEALESAVDAIEATFLYRSADDLSGLDVRLVVVSLLPSWSCVCVRARVR